MHLHNRVCSTCQGITAIIHTLKQPKLNATLDMANLYQHQTHDLLSLSPSLSPSLYSKVWPTLPFLLPLLSLLAATLSSPSFLCHLLYSFRMAAPLDAPSMDFLADSSICSVCKCACSRTRLFHDRGGKKITMVFNLYYWSY